MSQFPGANRAEREEWTQTQTWMQENDLTENRPLFWLIKYTKNAWNTEN